MTKAKRLKTLFGLAFVFYGLPFLLITIDLPFLHELAELLIGSIFISIYMGGAPVVLYIAISAAVIRLVNKNLKRKYPESV